MDVNPEIDAFTSMKVSWEKMKGYKADYLVYCLLTILLCNLGLIVLFAGIANYLGSFSFIL